MHTLVGAEPNRQRIGQEQALVASNSSGVRSRNSVRWRAQVADLREEVDMLWWNVGGEPFPTDALGRLQLDDNLAHKKPHCEMATTGTCTEAHDPLASRPYYGKSLCWRHRRR